MTYAWAGIFAFSGNFKAYLHIQNGTCVLEDRFSGEPDLMTHTPSEVWLEIARKELSGQQAFFVRRVHGGWQSGAPDEDERILFRGGPFIKGGKFRHQRNGADFFGKAERHKKTHSLNPTTKERKIP